MFGSFSFFCKNDYPVLFSTCEEEFFVKMNKNGFLICFCLNFKNPFLVLLPLLISPFCLSTWNSAYTWMTMNVPILNLKKNWSINCESAIFWKVGESLHRLLMRGYMTCMILKTPFWIDLQEEEICSFLEFFSKSCHNTII